MTKEERLQKIREVSKQINELEKQKEMRLIQLKNYFINEKFKPYAERISALMEVANELIENHIMLGKYIGGRKESPEFISEAIFHELGFIPKHYDFFNPLNVTIYAIGFKGGGCDGYDFAINEDGIVVSCNDKELTMEDEFRTKKFVKEFDKFERKFYEYVDNLSTNP